MGSITFGENYATPSWKILQRMFKKVGVKKVATTLKLGYSTVSQWQNDPDSLSDTGRRNPLDRVNIMRETVHDAGYPELALEGLHWLADQAGYILVKKTNLPTIDDSDGLMEEVLKFAAESGDVQRVIIDAIEDHYIDAEERERILKELRHAQEQAARVELIVRIGKS